MTPTTLVIATSSALIQQGLSALVREMPDVSLSAVTTDQSETTHALRGCKPDVLLVDAILFAEMRAQNRTMAMPRVLLLSARAHIGTALQVLSSCACGFASERAHMRLLRASLRIITVCRSRLWEGYCASCPLRSTLKPPTLPLSEREYMVFERIGNGDSAAKIAEAVGLSVKTIETYRDSIKRKLALGSAAALQEAATQWKWGEHINMTRVAAEAQSSSGRRRDPGRPARSRQEPQAY